VSGSDGTQTILDESEQILHIKWFRQASNPPLAEHRLLVDQHICIRRAHDHAYPGRIWVWDELVKQHPSGRAAAEDNVEDQQIGLLALDQFEPAYEGRARKANVAFSLEQILNQHADRVIVLDDCYAHRSRRGVARPRLGCISPSPKIRNMQRCMSCLVLGRTVDLH